MAIYTSDHIGKWYWLRYDNNIVLAEEFSTELSRAVSNKQLIQGDAGVHVMSVNGKTMTSTLSSDVLIEIPQAKYNPVFTGVRYFCEGKGGTATSPKSATEINSCILS